MKWSLNHKEVSLILIVEANFYLDVWNTLLLFCDSLAPTILNENSEEACSDWLTTRVVL